MTKISEQFLISGQF